MSDWSLPGLEERFEHTGVTNEEQAWDIFKREFVLKSAEDRIWDLRRVDSWIGDEVKPTKTFASSWQKQRDLTNLHNDLLKIGR